MKDRNNKHDTFRFLNHVGTRHHITCNFCCGNNTRWLSQGLTVSSKRTQPLNNLKRTVTLTSKALSYIEKYQRTYKRILWEAKKGITIGTF
jgi:hypothetical protein